MAILKSLSHPEPYTLDNYNCVDRTEKTTTLVATYPKENIPPREGTLSGHGESACLALPQSLAERVMSLPLRRTKLPSAAHEVTLGIRPPSVPSAAPSVAAAPEDKLPPAAAAALPLLLLHG